MSDAVKEVFDINGKNYDLTSEITRGGQGVIYITKESDKIIKLELNGKGEFIKKENQIDKFEYLRLLPIDRGTNITLPLTVLKDYSGYVMKLLEDMLSFREIFDSYNDDYINNWLDQFKEMEDFVKNYGSYIKSGGKRRRINAYLKLAENLLKLHNNGLVYCDLSTNNIFLSVNEKNNNVWLIDADNLNFQSLVRGYYTPGFAAPEVVKGKGCTFYSDSYSFAISLFLQLLGTHPFKGKLLENNDDFDDDDFIDSDNDIMEKKANDGELPYIMSDEDTSNAIETNIAYNLTLSEDLKEIFQNIFSEDSKKNRIKRNNMHEWCYILAKELDNDIKCKHCEMTYSKENLKECPWCDTVNEIISIKTYDTEENKIWEYTQEIDQNEKEIPLRIIEDYDLNLTNEVAFSVKYLKGCIHIHSFNNSYHFIESKKRLVGENIYNKKELNIECISKETNKKIIIKLEIL